MHFDVAIVADDLTGACDSGVAFAERGLQVLVEVERGQCDPEGVLVVNSESRDVGMAEARRRLRDCMERVAGATLLMKKVDSLFRGNTLEEIVAMVETMPRHILLLAPAFPEMDRVAVGGLVLHEGGQRSIAVVPMLRARGVIVEHVAASEQSSVTAKAITQGVQRGCRVYFCDASTSEHMRAIAEAGALLEGPVLWTGSGGLAWALATLQHARPQRTRPRARCGRAVIVAGTKHPRTTLQLQRLRAAAQPAELLSAVCEMPFAGSRAALLVTIGGADDRIILQRLAEDLAPETTGCIVMTGGHTALTTCRTLGVTALELVEEFARGVPMGVLRGGRMDGTTVVLKSGGFGESELLVDIMRRFEKVED